MSAHTRTQDFIGETVKLTLKEGSVLHGTVISLGIARGLAVRSNLPSAHEWPFRAEDIATIQRTHPE